MGGNGGVEIDAAQAISHAQNLADVAQRIHDLLVRTRPALEARFLDTGEEDAEAIRSHWYDALTRNVNDVLNVAGSNVDALGEGAHAGVHAFGGQDTDTASAARRLTA
jgi:hypothetical protein